MTEETLDQGLLQTAGKKRFKIRAVVIWSILLLIGLGCRLVHFPGGSALLICCSAGLQAYCLNGLFHANERNRLNSGLSLLGLLLFLFLLWAAFFNEGIPYNTNALMTYLVVFLVYFILYFLMFQWLKNRVLK
jgi:hypothetical protein